MSIKVFDTQEVQDLLKAAVNLNGKDGNSRLKQGLCQLIETEAERPQEKTSLRKRKTDFG